MHQPSVPTATSSSAGAADADFTESTDSASNSQRAESIALPRASMAWMRSLRSGFWQCYASKSSAKKQCAEVETAAEPGSTLKKRSSSRSILNRLKSWSSSSRTKASKDWEKVSKRLEEMSEWRKEAGADDIREALDNVLLSDMHKITKELSAAYLERFPWFVYGVDKDGDPVLYATLPKSGAASGVDIAEMQRGRLVQCEAAARVHRALNPGVASKHRVVVNMSNLSLGHLRPRVVRTSKSIVEPDYYFPGICKAVVLVRLPSFARRVLGMAIKLIPARILRAPPAIGKPLEQFVDKSQIPREYGGTAQAQIIIGGAVFPKEPE